MEDTEAIQAVNGFGYDKWIDGIFGHPLWSLTPRGFTGISSSVRQARKNAEPEWSRTAQPEKFESLDILSMIREMFLVFFYRPSKFELRHRR